MNNKKFIEFNEKNSTVEITLNFRVKETENINFVPKHKLTFHQFSEILLDALEQRMKHCQDVLTSQILPATDKVFTRECIFSNEVGKHFSIVAYTAMEHAIESLKNFQFFEGKDIHEFGKQLTRSQAMQCFKALATMQTNIDEDLLQECVDYIAEVLDSTPAIP